MFSFQVSYFSFQVPNDPIEMCQIGTYVDLHNDSGVMDVICINTMASRLLSLGRSLTNNTKFEQLVTVKFNNGTCKVRKKRGEKFNHHCFEDYFTASFQNVTDINKARWKCYDPIAKNIQTTDRQSREERRTPTTPYAIDRNAFICDVQCESSDLNVNILHIIEDIVTRKYENTRKIYIQQEKYEFAGTYICQIVFPNNRKINGTGYQISIQGILIELKTK